MAHRNAATLMVEMARSHDPRVRRNAAGALTSAGSDDALREVVRMAVEDDDATVRSGCEDDIAALGNPLPDGVISALHHLLESTNSRVGAYSLIGRLRSRGIDARLPRMNLPRRLALAFAAAAGKQPHEGNRNLGPLIRSVLLGSGIGIVILLVAVPLVTGQSLGGNFVAGLFFPGLLFPLIAALVTRRWWAPMQRQPDRLAAALLEIAAMGLIGAVVGFVTALFISVELSDEHFMASAAWAILAAGAGFAAVRAGALWAHGIIRRAPIGRQAQALSGFGSGLIVATAIAANHGTIASLVWITVLPQLLAMAQMAATVDATEYRVRPARRIAGYLSWPLALAPLVTVLVVLSLALSSRPPDRMRVKEPDWKTDISIPVSRLPYGVELDAPSPRMVTIKVRDDGDSSQFATALSRGRLQGRNLERAMTTGNAANLNQLAYRDGSQVSEYLTPDHYYVLAGLSSRFSEVLPSRILNDLLAFTFHRNLCVIVISSEPADPTHFSSAMVQTTAAGQDQPTGKVAKVTAPSDLYSSKSKYEAFDFYTNAVRSDPTNATAHVYRATTLDLLGLPDLALQDLDAALKLSADVADARGLRGSIYLKSGKYEQAISDLTGAIASGSGTRWRLARGAAHFRLNELELAYEDYSEASRVDARDPVALEGRASANFRLGKYPQALQDYNAAIAVAPDWFGYYVSRGGVHNRLSEFKEGLSDLNRAIDLNPEASAAYTERARSHSGLKKFQEALADLNTAIELESANAEAYALRADVRARIQPGDPAAAADLRRAGELGYKEENRGWLPQ